MKRRAPAYLRYADDSQVAPEHRLSLAGHGLRALFGDLQWRSPSDNVPGSAAAIAWEIRRPVEEVEPALRDVLALGIFKVDGDTIFDPQLRAYKQKLEELSEKRAAAGAQGGTARKANAQAIASASATAIGQARSTSTPTPSGSSLRSEPAGDPAKEEIWRKGRRLLEGSGLSKGGAGAFLGALVKDYGQKLVLEAVRDAAKVTPADPRAWLTARCQERRAHAENWMADDKATERKGRELGLAPKIGELMPAYRERLRSAIAERARRVT